MNASAALLDAAAEVIPGGVNTCRRRSEPRLCFRRGDGAYLEDLDGRRYVDYHAAYGAVFLGHSHPAVNDRVSRAMRDTVLFGVGVTEAEVALARKIAEHVPSVEQVVVCNSGSEATYHAIRLARGVTGRQKLDQVPGLLRRLPRLRAPQRPQPLPTGIGRRDPHSAGMLEAAVDATLVCRLQRPRRRAGDARTARRGRGGDHRRAVRAQLARPAPARRLPRPGCARSATRPARC